MSRFRRTSLLAASAVALSLAASQASANVLINIDFDANPAAAAYSYKYAGGGTGGGDVSISGAVSAVGVAGSNAYSCTADSTAANKGAGSYWGVGIAATNTAATTTVAPAASDLTYSVDVYAGGLRTGQTGASLRIQMRFYDSVTNTMLWQTRNGMTYNQLGQFQTLTGDLGSASTLSGSYANMIASPNPMKIEFTVEASNGAGNFGYDTDNVLTFDNISVSDVGTPVPEPASLGLLAVAGLGLVTLRRR